jgi:hypothetical protein
LDRIYSPLDIVNKADITTKKTTAAIIAFVLALFFHPDVAQKSFEEIQTVTAGERLPKVSDRSSLPYTEAVFKEAMRKYPIIPLGTSCPVPFGCFLSSHCLRCILSLITHHLSAAFTMDYLPHLAVSSPSFTFGILL